MRMIERIVALAMAISASVLAWPCTSMLVSSRASADGRPLMWKHRDTGAEQNFIERVPAAGDLHGYVALYNGGDSLLAEAWMGMNDAGFAVMNTASYNLAPDTASYKDREGEVMARALAQCVTVDDFAELLRTLPKPLGVQANFGAMDAHGGLAYFETDDYDYKRYDVADEECGYIVRTNHSMSGNDTDGYGYIRYQNVYDILGPEMAEGQLTPMSFTEKASRSFWHSLLQRDVLAEPGRWAVDQDFIPRGISTASIVIEGVNPGDDVSDQVMWTALGYPPCAVTQRVTIDDVPSGLRPVADGWLSPDCIAVLELKRQAFPLTVGNGQRYIDLDFLRRIIPEQQAKSMQNYKQYRK